jgi:cysteinyl-tRNA synthetase
LENDAAYVVDGDIYYRVEKDADYGKLSGRKLEEMHAGARIDVDERKEHPMDFAVWKSAKPGEPAWDSPWGPGRPGWHIECSAMVFHHLGQQIDIHGGGNDLIFPHHENEIAQSEALTGKPFARYWMHNGLMQFSGEKMSRSVGNLISIKAFLEDHEPDVLRMMVLNSGYRRPLAFGDEVIEAATRGLERLRSGLRPALPGAKGAQGADVAALTKLADDARPAFIGAMDDDFNTASALALLFELVRQINQVRELGALNDQLEHAQNVLRELSEVFGLRLLRAQKQTALKTYLDFLKSMNLEVDFKKKENEIGDPSLYIDQLVLERQRMRAEKDWQKSDQIRDWLAQQGVLVEDSAGGSSWRWA